MAFSRTAPLLLLLTIAALFNLSAPSSPFASAGDTSLAVQVCRNTTDFDFCRATIYADPRAPVADRVILAYIAFGKAYRNATHTRDLISVKIGEAGGGNRRRSAELIGLRGCLADYKLAVQIFQEVLGDLDSESYYKFDVLSSTAKNYVTDCEKGLAGKYSPVGHENVVLVKIINICYVVSKLFKYSS